MSTSKQIWGDRLKQARLAADLSQKRLGIEAGIDPFVASTRINRYEVGVHEPDYLTARNLAKVLKVPAAFLYAAEDDVADLLFRYGHAKSSTRSAIRKLLADIPSAEELALRHASK
ncbi:helix-turn-helix protein [Variovorax sp. 54]|uniref:helix-turn-helix domain-containing protein n=1 Tax=Variovorax sp. 54 TaxID=2035212 RepID=UPI000C199BCE|nr:helix-turn-helix transcriptional regulator [Variovorax sp. 54]PIF77508.1 helix-turn-helix protein [Variovorax sp. 54]